MKKSIILLMLPVMLAVSLLSAGTRYEIDTVVEIGPGRSARWSPDGTIISLFQGCNLIISDMLGNKDTIMAVESSPIASDWLSDFEIIVHTSDRSEGKVYREKLIIADLNTKSSEIIEQYSRASWAGYHYYANSFSGIEKSIEGRIFYWSGVKSLFSPKSNPVPKFPQSEYGDENVSDSIINCHFLRWGDDGLYKMKCSFLDSVWIAPNFGTVLPATINPDESYIMHRQFIYNVEDSTTIALSDYIKEPYRGCQFIGAIDGSFNPNPDATEIVITLIYSNFNEFENEICRIATFDYEAGEVTFLDNSTGIEDGEYPVYSPDGRNIIFRKGCNLYLVMRQEIN